MQSREYVGNDELVRSGSAGIREPVSLRAIYGSGALAMRRLRSGIHGICDNFAAPENRQVNTPILLQLMRK